MLLRAIENVRRKPKPVRKRYAFVVAVVFTALVAGVWSFSLPARFGAIDGAISAAPGGRETSQSAGLPFSGMFGQIRQQFSDIMNTGGAPTATSDSSASAVPAASMPPPANDPVLLESGSTIRFGVTAPEAGAPAIMIGTSSTSTNPVSSPAGS